MSANQNKNSKSKPQNQFVAMVKECIDSQFALVVLQKFSSGSATLTDVIKDIPEANEQEISNILEKITRYTLISESTMEEQTYTLTESGKEFLAILSDIDRLKLRYQN